MKKTLSLIALAFALLTSCEKELDINYHEVAPLYVIEAGITEEGATARISQTLNVTDTLWNKSVDNAQIHIISDHGESYTLTLDSAGSYSSPLAKGIPGHKYTIKVKIGDYETEASSVMQSPFNVEDTYIYKVQILEDELVCYRIDVEDEGTNSNYYYALVSRNGKPYKWQVIDNKGFIGTTEIDVPCFAYCEMDKDNKDILKDGEDISVEIRKVDRTTYDYLYAIAIAEEVPSNPIQNFSKSSTLGYFSAYNVQKIPSIKYKKDSVEYYEERARRVAESKKGR